MRLIISKVPSDLKESGSGERADGLTQLGWPSFSRSSLTSAPGPDGGVRSRQKGLLQLISICHPWQPQPQEGWSAALG